MFASVAGATTGEGVGATATREVTGVGFEELCTTGCVIAGASPPAAGMLVVMGATGADVTGSTIAEIGGGWLALVTATAPAGYQTLTGSVCAIDGGDSLKSDAVSIFVGIGFGFGGVVADTAGSEIARAVASPEKRGLLSDPPDAGGGLLPLPSPDDPPPL